MRNNSIFTKQNGIQLGDLFQRLAFTPRGVGACGDAGGNPERRKKTRGLVRPECYQCYQPQKEVKKTDEDRSCILLHIIEDRCFVLIN